jgi:hypothetical protein
MKSEYGLSTYGRPIVVAEVGAPPTVRSVFAGVTLLIGAWVLVHVNRALISALRQRKDAAAGSRKSMMALVAAGWKPRQADATDRLVGRLVVAFALVSVLYNSHQAIHIAHFADNIARPVDYKEPKWLYDRYLVSTMEITFAFNVPVSIFGASVASSLPRVLLRLVDAVGEPTSDQAPGEPGEAPPAIDGSLERLVPSSERTEDIARLRLLCNKLLLYTSSAALTVMHYRVESMRLYSAATTFTIAGEGLAGLALALALWYLKVQLTRMEENAKPEREQSSNAKMRSGWMRVRQSNDDSPSESSPVSPALIFTPSPEDGQASARAAAINPPVPVASSIQREARSGSTSESKQIRHRSPVRS